MLKKKLVISTIIGTIALPIGIPESVAFANSIKTPVQQSAGSEETVPTHQRTFKLEGKGDVKNYKKIHRTQFSLSPLEPTGYYVKPNEEVTIEVVGANDITAYLGASASYGGQTRVEKVLTPGVHTISSDNGGLLFFGNTNDGGIVQVSILKGGTPIPFYVLGKTTKAEFKTMMESFPDAYAVQLKGNRTLITSTYASASKHLMDNTSDIDKLLELHDQINAIQDEFSGVGFNYEGVAKADPHYVHHIENVNRKGGAYASTDHAAYSTGGMSWILNPDTLKKSGWGAWHEQGHLRNQPAWMWKDMTESVVNLFAMYTQRALGNESRYEKDKVYDKALKFINLPAEQKNFDAQERHLKNTLFWQLDLAFGKHFFPKLHQAYRLLADSEIPRTTEEEKQLVIYMASKVANRNLVPHFEKYGVWASEETKSKVAKFPNLQQPIWKGRDSAPIIEGILPAYDVPSALPIPQTVPVGWDANQIRDPNSWVSNLTASAHVSKINLDLSKANQIGTATAEVLIEDQNNNTNTILVPVNIIPKTSIVLQGVGNWNSVSISFNHEAKKIHAVTPSRTRKIHSAYKTPFFEMKVFDGVTNKLKLDAKGIGNESPSTFVDTVNNQNFEYGDRIEIIHQEANRYDIVHLFNHSEPLPVLRQKKQTYFITPTGFVTPDEYTGRSIE